MLRLSELATVAVGFPWTARGTIKELVSPHSESRCHSRRAAATSRCPSCVTSRSRCQRVTQYTIGSGKLSYDAVDYFFCLSIHHILALVKGACEWTPAFFRPSGKVNRDPNITVLQERRLSSQLPSAIMRWAKRLSRCSND